MSNNGLLELAVYNHTTINGSAITPLMLELPVNSDTAPYLVSSASGLMWIHSPFGTTKPMVRAAVRKIKTPSDVFLDVSNAIRDMSLEMGWGNINSYSERGLNMAIEHVSSYYADTVDILVNPGHKLSEHDCKDRPRWLMDRDLNEFLLEAPWVPLNQIVVVPSDRNNFGTMYQFSGNKAAILVHDPSRGFAMCR